MSLDTATPQPGICAFRLSLPQTEGHMAGRANSALLELFQCMRKFRSTVRPGQSWNWRQSHLSPKGELFRVSRKLLNAAPVYPRVAQDRKKRIGFVVPIAEFGGVEKVAYNLASVTRNNGWWRSRLHCSSRLSIALIFCVTPASRIGIRNCGIWARIIRAG